MSHFEELCALSAEVEEKQQSVESIIRREAERLIAFWQKWLELPAKYWIDDTGQKIPYIAAGHMVDGYFMQAPVSSIPMDKNGTLRLVLQTCVGTNSSHPSFRVSVNLQVISAGELGVDVAVAVNDDKPIEVFVSATDSFSYNSVAESIKKHIQKTIQAGYPRCLL